MIQGSIHDEHKQISDKLITPESVSSLIQRAIAGTREPRKLLTEYVLKGHPAWAAGLSGLMIAFTEALAVFDGFTRFRIILGIERGD